MEYHKYYVILGSRIVGSYKHYEDAMARGVGRVLTDSQCEEIGINVTLARFWNGS